MKTFMFLIICSLVLISVNKAIALPSTNDSTDGIKDKVYLAYVQNLTKKMMSMSIDDRSAYWSIEQIRRRGQIPNDLDVRVICNVFGKVHHQCTKVIHNHENNIPWR